MKLSQLIELQVALAIEILTVAPIRRKNLVELQVDKNLISRGSGQQRLVNLYFPADDVKNEQEIEFELPPSTTHLLDRYLNEVRPRLQGTPSPYLFPGRTADHKTGYLISTQIADLTAAEIGVRITAHQFRHIAGFLFLKTNPGGHEVVRRLLGHKAIETTLTFYAGMETSAALRRFDQLIAGERERLRPTQRGRMRNGKGGSHAR